MKFKKEKTDTEIISTEKVCKKCGDPLRSTSKYKYCVNCRRERTKRRKEVMGLCLVGLSLVPGVKHFVKK